MVDNLLVCIVPKKNVLVMQCIGQPLSKAPLGASCCQVTALSALTTAANWLVPTQGVVISHCLALTAGTIQSLKIAPQTDFVKNSMDDEHSSPQKGSPSTRHSQQMKPKKSPQSVRMICTQHSVQTGPSSQAESPASNAASHACSAFNLRQATSRKLQTDAPTDTARNKPWPMMATNKETNTNTAEDSSLSLGGILSGCAVVGSVSGCRA